LLASGAVYINEKPLQKKYKFRNGDIVDVNRQELINIYLIGKEEVFLNTADDK